MRFGVNYTPSHGWFHAWLDPDWESVAKDLDQIAALGLDHVRIFPVWPILQPNRTWINGKGLDDVRTMCDIAGKAGLDVFCDVFQGHLSSFDFIPSWLVTWHDRSMFTDAQAVEAEARLVSAVYDALDDLPNFRGLTLGNECNQFADRSHPHRMAADETGAGQWIDAMMSPIRDRAAASGRVLLHSENDGVWYMDGHPFAPRQASNLGDVATVHSWVFNGTAQRYGGMSPASVMHAAYLVELAKTFTHDAGHQVWLQEVGAPENVVDRADAAEFCRRTVEHALRCDRLYGITWWCSHDVSRAMSDFPPFEHALGLFDEQGNAKPLAKVLAEFAANKDAVVPERRGKAIVIPVDDHELPLCRLACAPGGSIFERWMAMEEAGEHPALISSTLAADPAELERRGIDECITCDLVAGDAYSAVSDPSLARD